MLYMKFVTLILAYASEKIIKFFQIGFGIIPKNCISLPVYTWPCGLKKTASEH